MQLKFEEPYLGRGREGEEQACSPRVPAAREGQAASRSGLGLGRTMEGGIEVGAGGGVRGGVEVGDGGGVESGVRGGVEGVWRARGDRRAAAAARAEEFDLGEVAVGKDERGG